MRIGSSLVGGWLLLVGGLGVISCGDDDSSSDPSSETGGGGSGASSGSGGSGKGGTAGKGGTSGSGNAGKGGTSGSGNAGGARGGDTGDDGGTAGVPGSGGEGASTPIGGEGGAPSGGQGGEAGALPVGGEGGTGERGACTQPCYDDDPCTTDACAGQSCVNEPVACSVLKGGSGGTAYTDLCPDGQVVIGYEGHFNDTVSGNYPMTVMRLATICGAPMIPDSDGPVTVTETTVLPVRGSHNALPFDRRCPTNHVVVGFGGSTIDLLTDLVVHCAAVSVASGEISIGSTTPLNELNVVENLGTFAPVNCPEGQVVKGSAIRAGEAIDAFGVVCEALPAP